MSAAVAPTSMSSGVIHPVGGFRAVVAGSGIGSGAEPPMEPPPPTRPGGAAISHASAPASAVDTSAEPNGRFQANSPPPVGLFWDLTSCGLPDGKSRSEVTTMDWERTARSVRRLGESLGPVARFVAYLNRKDAAPPADVERQAIAAAGADIVEAGSMALDMAFFAVDHKAPATIVLLASEGSHTGVLQRLRDRSYKVVLVSNFQQSAATQPQPQPQLTLKQPQLLPFQQQQRVVQTAASAVQGVNGGGDAPGPQQKKTPAAVTRQSLRELTAFLEAHPHGLDGPAVASWLQHHVPGGPGTFGFPRLRPFLDAAHQAGVLQLSASGPGPDAAVRVFPPGPAAAAAAAAAAPTAIPPPQPRGAWAATAAAPPHPSIAAGAGSPVMPGRMAVSRRTLVPLVRLLESNPRGVDGGEVSKLLREHFGGFGAFGFDRLKSFLEAADRAGVCRLRAGASTLWVMPVAPPAPPTPPQLPAAASIDQQQQQRVPLSPGAARSPAGARRGSGSAPDIFIELRKYLQGFPGGVDGGVLNLWLESAVGGYKALGYPRLKPFLQDAEDAGMCRCSTDSGTLWVTPVFPGDAPGSSSSASSAAGAPRGPADSSPQPPPLAVTPSKANTGSNNNTTNTGNGLGVLPSPPSSSSLTSSSPPGFLGGLQVDVRASAASALLLGAPGDRRSRAPGAAAPPVVNCPTSVVTPAPLASSPGAIGATAASPQQQQQWFGPLFGGGRPQGSVGLVPAVPMHSPHQPHPKNIPSSPQQQQQQQGVWMMAL